MKKSARDPAVTLEDALHATQARFVLNVKPP